MAYLGRYDTDTRAEDEGVQVINVVEFIPHPDYERPYNDIAVLKLETPAKNPQLIAMNTNPDFPSETGTPLRALGWGSITNGVDEPFEFPNILQQVTVQYVAFEDCAVASDPETGVRYGFSTTETGVTPDWLCTTDPVGAVCLGDSGGPVIRPGANFRSDLLAGIVSG